jgi:hypothetical protein
MANDNVIARKITTITLRDGKDYHIEPLTLNELIKVWPIIQKLEQSKDEITPALLESMKDIVYVALQRKVEKDKIGDLVDLLDLKEIIGAVVGQAS